MVRLMVLGKFLVMLEWAWFPKGSAKKCRILLDRERRLTLLLVLRVPDATKVFWGTHAVRLGIGSLPFHWGNWKGSWNPVCGQGG
jgi:hypothetical protein